MQVQNNPLVNVLYSAHYTTLEQLDKFGPVMAELYAEAGRKGCIAGPLHWLYYNVNEKQDGLFMLEIALPIRKTIQSKQFSVKKLDLSMATGFPHKLCEELPGKHLQLQTNSTPLRHLRSA